jgi:hypothetical protein
MNAAASFGFPDEGPSRPIQKIEYVPQFIKDPQNNKFFGG